MSGTVAEAQGRRGRRRSTFQGLAVVLLVVAAMMAATGVATGVAAFGWSAAGCAALAVLFLALGRRARLAPPPETPETPETP